MGDEDETIDLTELDAETVRDIQYAVSGYLSDQDREEMTDYRTGKQAANHNVMGMLEGIIEQIDDDYEEQEN